MRIRRMRLKICVAGECGVGKTSLILRYMQGQYVSQTEPGRGVKMYTRDVDLDVDKEEVLRAKVAFFDLPGDPAIRDMFHEVLFYGTHGVLAVCDITRPPTLYAIADWIRVVSLVTGGVPFCIALNKGDTLAEAPLGREETLWLREQFPIVPAILTSAFTGEGVTDVFDKLLLRAVQFVREAKDQERSADQLRRRILEAVKRKESTGMSTQELVLAFKEVGTQVLMEELDLLARLDLLFQDESGPKTFVPTTSPPAVFRFRITPAGRRFVDTPSKTSLVVDEDA